MASGEIKLSLVNGKYDIDFDDEGDFVQDEGLETAILMSLLLNKRADSTEAPQPVNRGGYWGYEINNMEFSKLWIVRGRLTTDKINAAIEYSNSALQWLIEEGYATRIETEAEFVRSNDIKGDGIKIDITITKVNDIILSKDYTLWINTDL